MKKFWIVLLSLGLLAAFCMPAAAAVEMKWKGEYIVTGSYEDNREMSDNDPSMAFYAQRLRFEPEFKIAEGLNLYTRFDTLQRVWGQFPVGGEEDNPSSARNPEQEQNIQWRRGWVSFAVPYGMFMVGYMADGVFGVGGFGSFPGEGPNALFITKLGPVVTVVGFEKVSEGRLGGGAFNGLPGVAGKVDSDFDKYYLGGTYYGGWGELGLTGVYYRAASLRPAFDLTMNFYWIESHGKFTAGPFYAEYEVVWEFGKEADWDKGVDAKNVKTSGVEYYVMGKYSLGPAYIGAMYGRSPGDDPDTETKNEGGIILNGYGVWQPCLILYNDWLDRFAGPMGDDVEQSSAFNNAQLVQVFAGFSPTPKLALKTSLTKVWAEEKQKGSDPLFAPYTRDIMGEDGYVETESRNIGVEFDVQAAYKIYDNLEYMLGFGYLWAGNYFKEKDSTDKVKNDYLIINQLTLSF